MSVKSDMGATDSELVFHSLQFFRWFSQFDWRLQPNHDNNGPSSVTITWLCLLIRKLCLGSESSSLRLLTSSHDEVFPLHWRLMQTGAATLEFNLVFRSFLTGRTLRCLIGCKPFLLVHCEFLGIGDFLFFTCFPWGAKCEGAQYNKKKRSNRRSSIKKIQSKNHNKISRDGRSRSSRQSPELAACRWRCWWYDFQT